MKRSQIQIAAMAGYLPFPIAIVAKEPLA